MYVAKKSEKSHREQKTSCLNEKRLDLLGKTYPRQENLAKLI